jgi:two-component system, OmpR family, alkaline phosphatase synthesis response regulator PhoP
MTAQRVIVVDDEEPILAIVDYALTQEGFEVHTACDAEAAEVLLGEVSADLVILDVVLPGRSGLEVARDLRARSTVPIIILSARADEVDRILGLEFGADDYVTKPFSPRELVCRVKAILRRAGATGDEKELISVGDLHVDTMARLVSMHDEEVHLTSSEYSILLHLVRHHGTALSREAILDSMGEESPIHDERAIDVHIHNIREKLEPDPRNPSYILTVRGFGYRLAEPIHGT